MIEDKKQNGIIVSLDVFLGDWFIPLMVKLRFYFCDENDTYLIIPEAGKEMMAGVCHRQVYFLFPQVNYLTKPPSRKLFLTIYFHEILILAEIFFMKFYQLPGRSFQYY